jgi:hypothetical protein
VSTRKRSRRSPPGRDEMEVTLLEALRSPERLQDFVASRYDARITPRTAGMMCEAPTPRWIREWGVSEGAKQHRFKFAILPHMTQDEPFDRPTANAQCYYPFDDVTRVIYKVGPTGVKAGGWNASPSQETAIRELEDARATGPECQLSLLVWQCGSAIWR